MTHEIVISFQENIWMDFIFVLRPWDAFQIIWLIIVN